MMEAEAEDGESYIMYGESTALLLLFGLGLLTNVPVLILYARSKHIRSITDKFLFNLLLTDVASLVFLFPAILTSFYNFSFNNNQGVLFLETTSQYQIGASTNTQLNDTDEKNSNVLSSEGGGDFDWYWALSNAIIAGTAAASVISALEIAVERYLAVVKPLQYHRLLTTPSIFMTSVAGAVVATGVAIGAFLEPSESIFPHSTNIQSRNPLSSKTEIDPNSNSNHALWDFANLNHKDDLHTVNERDLIWALFSLTIVTFLFILPVVLMVYIYTRVWMEARRQKIKLANQYKPYFVPIPKEHQDDKEHVGSARVKVMGAFLPVLIKFKLMNRIKATRLDRAGKVAVIALFVTILCWSPYYIFKASYAIRTIMIGYGYSDISISIDSLSTPSSSWTKILPLLFASLHPVLCPLFYAYRYKRVRKEIFKSVSSLIFSNDHAGVYASDHHNANPTMKGHNNEISLSTNSNGSVSSTHLDSSSIIRQSVTIPPVTPTPPTKGISQGEDPSTPRNPQICINIFDEDSNSIGSGNDEQEVMGTGGIHEDDVQQKSTESGKAVIVSSFLNYLNVFMSNYSRRWLQHRDSVTSTASFVALLSRYHNNKSHAEV